MDAVLQLLLSLLVLAATIGGTILTSLLFPWAALWFLEKGIGIIPIVGKVLAKVPHWLRQKYVFVITWPIKKMWALMVKYGPKFLRAAWRGFADQAQILWRSTVHP